MGDRKADMQDGRVQLARDGTVAFLILDRPAKLNAMTVAMTDALAAHCAAIEADPDIRVVVVRGEGRKGFCAGSDIGSLAHYGSAWEFRDRREYADVIRALTRPVVACLHGWVLGGGLEMAMAADIRIAGRGARFGQPEVKHGWIGGGGATQMLPRLVGYGQAMRLMLTGDPIDAAEALRIGLVDIVEDDAAVADAAAALAQRIATHPAQATRAVKAATRAALSMPLAAGLAYEREINALCFSGEAHRAGIAAFENRRRADAAPARGSGED